MKYTKEFVNSILVRVGKLIIVNQQLRKENEKLRLRVEELETMVFGKKGGSKKDTSKDDDEEAETESNTKESSARKKASRNKSSYTRSKPKQSEVTGKIKHPLEKCSECGEKLTNLKKVIRYVIDIPLLVDLISKLKIVEEHEYEEGYCPHCDKVSRNFQPCPQEVTIGPNIRQFIVYCHISLDLTYSQVGRFCEVMFDIKLSDGEISNILESQASQLSKYYKSLSSKIDKGHCIHADESVYKVIDGEGNYAWLKSNSTKPEVYVEIGKSRGRINAISLLPDNIDEKVLLTDGYVAYKGLTRYHSLCWAHPYRKLRELSESDTLCKEVRELCNAVYQQFSIIYETLESKLSEEFDIERRREQAKIIRFSLICLSKRTSVHYPDKLQKVLADLGSNADKYVECLYHEDVPSDNNKAERLFRPLVIKRKKSFNCKSKQGAKTLSILYSVVQSIQNRIKKPSDFFKEYNLALSCQ